MKCDKIGIRVRTMATVLKALTVVLTVSWGASAAARPSPPHASSGSALPVSQESEQRRALTRGNTVAAGDRQVLQRLHDANQMQIQMGQLAQDKGSARAVRDFGRRLIADHTQAEKMIGDYLRRYGLDVTTFATTTSQDPDHDLLATKSGLAFDQFFAAQVAIDHQKAIDLLETARNETADDDLMTLLDQLMTAERAHKRAARVLSPVSGGGA
jgi:putative membrane protein